MRDVRSVGIAVVVLLAVSMVAQGAGKYQEGTVIEVTKLPDTSKAAATTDKPPVVHMDRYDLKVQVGGKTYKARLDTPGGSNLDWVKGRKFDMRVAGKVLFAKTDIGGELRLPIVGTE